MNYEQAIDFIQSFPDAERGLPGNKPARSLKMPLSTMKAMLQEMGNPQNAARTIHITGSKGKGSTATFIAAILKQANVRSALFTSPHLHSYEERIAFNLQSVDQNLLARGISDLKQIVENFDQNGSTISTFGILTAVFFHLVKAANPPIPWQIVEVGLGGKDDLTNVFDNKEAVVITPVSLEHTAILGQTRTAIAENKAGIITPGCLVVLAPQPDPAVVKTIRQICLEKESELVDLNNNEHSPPSYPIQLRGEHQVDNAMTALALIDGLQKRKRISVSLGAIEKGMASAFIPGRFEVLGDKCTVVLDGAHNGDSAKALGKALHQVFPGRGVILVIGVNEDKDLEGIWAALKDTVNFVIATKSDNYRSLHPQIVLDRIKACSPAIDIVAAEDISEALTTAKDAASKISSKMDTLETQEQSIICVCGSLYLVAEARAKILL
jgi:dihydrofolate synthase/folylpolyglutamate synthase